jgi:hypothetical protein
LATLGVVKVMFCVVREPSGTVALKLPEAERVPVGEPWRSSQAT